MRIFVIASLVCCASAFQQTLQLTGSLKKRTLGGTTSVYENREFASLQPGTGIVTVKLGDPQLARKAWKKRRRSSSPILMPCSVLGMIDRARVVRDNIVYLVNRFGEELGKDLGGGKGGGFGMSLNLSEVKRRYKSTFRGSLQNHASELGYESVADMVNGLFDDKCKREYGVDVCERDGGLVIMSTLSRRRARNQAFSCGMAEVSFSQDSDDKIAARHTGRVKVKRDKESNPTLELLSAAVRLSRKDAEKYNGGEELNAFVFSFDQDGDAGEPFLIMSPDPTREQIRDVIKRKQNARRQLSARAHKIEVEANLLPITKDLSQLKVGEGPYTGRIVNISARAGAAFLDLGVGRRCGKSNEERRVFGMLRFQEWVDIVDSRGDYESSFDDEEVDDVTSVDDLFESDSDNFSESFSFSDEEKDPEELEKETVEDVTHMFELNEDGLMYQVDDENGEKVLLGSIDGESEESEDLFEGLSPDERLEAIQKMLSDDDEDEDEEMDEASIPSLLEVGTEVDVYVSSVSNQSGRFMVTFDSSVQGKKVKELKNEKTSSKRLNKLASAMGDGGIDVLMDLKGTVGDGIVRAKSKTGDWYYVQPGGTHNHLPIGVATVDSEDSSRISLVPGDRVKIRFEGIDGSRGQLALSLLNKCP